MKIVVTGWVVGFITLPEEPTRKRPRRRADKRKFFDLSRLSEQRYDNYRGGVRPHGRNNRIPKSLSHL